MPIRRTPKVFQSNYRAPKTADGRRYRSLKPLLWLSVAVMAIYLFGRLPLFRIQTVQVDGTVDEQLTKELEAAKQYSIFSAAIRRNTERVLASNLQLDSLDCRRGLPNTLRCQATMRQPVLIWKQNGQEWLIDKDGFVYASKSSDVRVPVVDDRGSKAVALRQTVASSDIVSFYNEVIRQLQANGLTVEQLFISESLYQVGANITGSTSPELPFPQKSPIAVLMTTSYPVESQVMALLEVLKTKNDQISERIDLRVPGYVYTK